MKVYITKVDKFAGKNGDKYVSLYYVDPRSGYTGNVLVGEKDYQDYDIPTEDKYLSNLVTKVYHYVDLDLISAGKQLKCVGLELVK